MFPHCHRDLDMAGSLTVQTTQWAPWSLMLNLLWMNTKIFNLSFWPKLTYLTLNYPVTMWMFGPKLWSPTKYWSPGIFLSPHGLHIMVKIFWNQIDSFHPSVCSKWLTAVWKCQNSQEKQNCREELLADIASRRATNLQNNRKWMIAWASQIHGTLIKEILSSATINSHCEISTILRLISISLLLKIKIIGL